MKKLIIISLIAVIVYFGYISTENKTIIFNSEEYKLARKEGADGNYKFHYTKSGKDTGKNDYIEVLEFDKSGLEPGKVKEVAGFINKLYKTKYVSGASGQFGVFGNKNNEYAYTVRSETAKSYFFVNYIVKSEPVSLNVATINSLDYIRRLNTLLSELETR